MKGAHTAGTWECTHLRAASRTLQQFTTALESSSRPSILHTHTHTHREEVHKASNGGPAHPRRVQAAWNFSPSVMVCSTLSRYSSCSCGGGGGGVKLRWNRAVTHLPPKGGAGEGAGQVMQAAEQRGGAEVVETQLFQQPSHRQTQCSVLLQQRDLQLRSLLQHIPARAMP